MNQDNDLLTDCSVICTIIKGVIEAHKRQKETASGPFQFYFVVWREPGKMFTIMESLRIALDLTIQCLQS